MSVSLQLTTQATSHIIKNLWPLYQHDVSQFNHARPNKFGLFGADDSITTLAQHAELQKRWWQEPEHLFPYLIRVDEKPAGFSLIAGKTALPKALDADYTIHEFFVLHPYRGNGTALQAAVDSINLHRGKWEIVTDPDNQIAIKFWRRVLQQISVEYLQTDSPNHPWGHKVQFHFRNNM